MMNYDISFINTDCELRSYFLGLWMSDGWLDTKGRVCISSSDFQIINDLAVKLNFTNKIMKQRNRKFRSADYSGTFQYTLAMRTPVLTNWIQSLGGTICKSGHEFIPSCVSDATFHHFLRGYTDGDGSILIMNHKQSSKKYLMWSLCSGGEDILTDILLYLKSRSIIAAPCCKVMYASIYRLKLGHADSLRVCEYLYRDATIMLDRKYQTYLHGLDIAPVLRHKLWTSDEDMELLTTGIVKGRSQSSCRVRKWKLLKHIE